MTAGLVAQRTRGPGTELRAELDAAVVVLCGELRHALAALRSLLDGGLRVLAASWNLPEKDVLVVESCLRTVVGPHAVFGAATLPIPRHPVVFGVESDFALAPLLFGEALTSGWPWDLALRLFSGLRRGRSFDGGLGSLPERGMPSYPSPGGAWLAGEMICSAAEPDVTVTFYFDDFGHVALVRCTRAVFGSIRRCVRTGAVMVGQIQVALGP